MTLPVFPFVMVHALLTYLVLPPLHLHSPFHNTAPIANRCNMVSAYAHRAGQIHNIGPQKVSRTTARETLRNLVYRNLGCGYILSHVAHGPPVSRRAKLATVSKISNTRSGITAQLHGYPNGGDAQGKTLVSQGQSQIACDGQFVHERRLLKENATSFRWDNGRVPSDVGVDLEFMQSRILAQSSQVHGQGGFAVLAE